jgi:hypothetical protein
MSVRPANSKRIFLDILLLALFPVLASILSFALRLNFLISTLLFFAVPSLYLSFRTARAVPRGLLFALLWSLPSGLVIDYFANVNMTWYVPNTLFPRVLNLIPLENLLWAFLISYLIVMFYEHFDDKCSSKKVGDSKIRNLLIFALIVLVVFIVVFLFNPNLFNIPYYYLFGGIIFILLPIILFYSKYSSTTNKFIHTGSYLLLISLFHEFTGLRLGHWTFPSREFIGWVELFGIRFPFEEFIFFFFLLTPAVLSYYEFLGDDRK